MRSAGLRPTVLLGAAEYNSAGRIDLEVYVPVPADNPAQSYDSLLGEAQHLLEEAGATQRTYWSVWAVPMAAGC